MSCVCSNGQQATAILKIVSDEKKEKKKTWIE